MGQELSQDDYTTLLGFRTGLRRYLRWSENQARAAGITPAQHQLLLAIKGLSAGQAPAVGDLADCLLLRHHSTVELIDRAERGGLVRRRRDPDDGRLMRVHLTLAGDRILGELTVLHLVELRRLAPVLRHLTADLSDLDLPPGS